MYKPKLGMITVSLPPELSTCPPEAVEIADDLGKRAEALFRKAGLEVVRVTQQAQSEEAAVAATEQLVAAGVDCIIYMVGSWIYMPIVVTPTKDLRTPFILWGVPEMKSAGLVPALIAHGSLDEMGIEHKFISGWPEDRELLDGVTKFCRAAMVVNRMDGMRYGLFGGRCMYMYTGMPDLIQMKRIFGVETVHVDEFMLVRRAEKIRKDRVTRFLRELSSQYGKLKPSNTVMERSARLYFALGELVKEYELDFVGLKCMPEVQGTYCSHCLSVALHNSEGLVVACEADTNAALSMEMLHLVSGGPAGFGDVFAIGMDDGKVRIANCGAMATAFAVSKKDVDWGLQYDFIAPGPGRGSTSVFVCKPGRITLARLARIKGDFVMEIASGEAYSEPKEKMKEVRDRWPHLFLTLDGDPQEFFQNCRSNHMHWTYGDYKDELAQAARLLNIRPIVI